MAKLVVAFLALAAIGCISATPVVPALQGLMAANPSGILPNLFITLKEGTSAVRNQMVAQTFANRLDRASFLTTGLKAHTAASQKNVLSFLNSVHSVQVQSFWISNTIFVSGATAELVRNLAAFPEIAEIREEKILNILDPIPANGGQVQDEPIGPLAEWGVTDIKAPEAWAAGWTGVGVLINTIDTGVRATHVSLRDNYIGANGWFDPYQNTAAPNDNNGHGTHTTATIAGSLGYGVAPGAKWSACKGCSTSSCTEVALIGCGQWVVCPNGAAPCQNVPHLSSNSWGGGRGDTFYNEVIANWHAADITPVFANGNSGPLCDTANSPADMNVIAVGSTNSAHGLSLFSSKGPALDGGIKPDISAPGTDVKSAWFTSDTATNTISGTSMACPHVSGVVALVKSASTANLNYAQVKDILFKTVDTDVTPTARNCGGIDTSTFPNNSYGYGKVNALKASQRAAGVSQ